MTNPVSGSTDLDPVSHAARSTSPDHPRLAFDRSSSPLRFLLGRYPVASFLVTAYAVFWLCWAPVLFLGASPRLFSALGVLLALAVPAFLVTAAVEGRLGSAI